MPDQICRSDQGQEDATVTPVTSHCDDPPCSGTLMAWPELRPEGSCIEAPAMPISLRLPYQRERSMAAALWQSSESVAAWACTQPQWQAHAGTQAAICSGNARGAPLRTPLEVQVASTGGVPLCVWVTASTSRFGGHMLALRLVRGLCRFKPLVAGRPPLSRVHPSHEWWPVCLGSSSRHSSASALLLSDQVRCGVPIVQHTACHTYSPGLCP
jgi:hypothetical protein